jgi:hypothetical protein
MERLVPEFSMRYEPGVVDRILKSTRHQPYLLQAIGSELVIQLNMRNRMSASGAASESATQRDCRKGSERLSFEHRDVSFLDLRNGAASGSERAS